MPKHQRKISKLKGDDVEEPTTMPGDKGHVPRPPNKWILYRSDKLKEFAQMGIPKQLQAKYSKMLSVMWENESAQVKEHYAKKSEEALKLHQLQHPDYKYQPKTKAQKVELRKLKDEKRELDDFQTGGESSKTKRKPSSKSSTTTTKTSSPSSLHYTPYPSRNHIAPLTPSSSNPTPQSGSSPLPANPSSDVPLMFTTSGPMYQPPPTMTLPSLVNSQIHANHPPSLANQWTRVVSGASSNQDTPPSPPEEDTAISSASSGEGFEFWQTLEGGVDWSQATPSPTGLGIIDTTPAPSSKIDYSQWNSPSDDAHPPPPAVDKSTRPTLSKPKQTRTSTSRVLPQTQDASISIPHSAVPDHPLFSQQLGAHSPSTALMLGSLSIDEQAGGTINPSNLSVMTPSTPSNDSPFDPQSLEVCMAPNWDGVVMRASDVDGRGLEGSGWWAAYTSDTFSGVPDATTDQGIMINGLPQQDFEWYTGGAGGPITLNSSLDANMDPNSMLNVEMDFSSLVQLLGPGASNDGMYGYAPVKMEAEEDQGDARHVSFGSMVQFPSEDSEAGSAPQSRVTSYNFTAAHEGDADADCGEHYRTSSLNFRLPNHQQHSTPTPRNTGETFIPPSGASNVGRRVAGSWRPPSLESPASSRAVSYASAGGVGPHEEWHGPGAMTYFGGGGPSTPSNGGQQYFAHHQHQQQPIRVASGSGTGSGQ